MSLRRWRYPIVELWMPLGYDRRVPHRVVFRPHPSQVFDIPLSYDAFTTGPSDYDRPSDEIYCPCGVTLPWSGDAGDLIRRVDDHCRSTLGHPMPTWTETF